MKRLMLAAVLALSACGMSAENRSMFVDAIVAELMFSLDQLQAIGRAQVEVSPETRIAVNLTCSLIAVAGPFMVDAINRKVAATNAERLPEDQTPPLTVEEFQRTLHALCAELGAIMVPEAPPIVLTPDDANA